MANVYNCLFCGIILISLIINIVLCEEDNGSTTIDNEDTDVFDGRTFGHHFLKRISFAMIPAAFVVGVITTLLAALTVISVKGLGVGVILLVLGIGQLLARSFPQQIAPTAYHQAPVPIVYSHRSSAAEHSAPVWIENDWS